MEVFVHTDRNLHADESEDRIEVDVAKAVERFAEDLTRVEVYLSDESAGRSAGDDIRSLLEAPRAPGPGHRQPPGSDRGRSGGRSDPQARGAARPHVRPPQDKRGRETMGDPCSAGLSRRRRRRRGRVSVRRVRQVQRGGEERLQEAGYVRARSSSRTVLGRQWVSLAWVADAAPVPAHLQVGRSRRRA